MACTGHKTVSVQAEAALTQSKADWAAGRAKWRAIVAENPTPHAFVQLATCEYKLGLYEVSLATCEKLIAADPIRYHQIRGIVFLKLRRKNDAAAAFHNMVIAAERGGTPDDKLMAADLLRACGDGKW